MGVETNQREKEEAKTMLREDLINALNAVNVIFLNLPSQITEKLNIILEQMRRKKEEEDQEKT
jgi:hypothetical protein